MARVLRNHKNRIHQFRNKQLSKKKVKKKIKILDEIQ